MTAPSRIPVRMLGDLISPRALERILLDAAGVRGQAFENPDIPTLEDILKKEVFKRLQLSVPAPVAKKRISEVLNELLKTTQERVLPGSAAAMAALEDGARRFSLYFDWAEAQRLRGLIGVLRDEEQAGRDVGGLLEEGQQLIGVMERRLAEQLVAQAQDLADLKATYGRVEGVGNRDVRRLDILIEQITEAQESGTLLPGEVERARDLAFKLRKLLESSVVQSLTGANGALDAEAQARVLALEQEHTGKLMGGLEREFGAMLRARPDLETQRQFLWAQHQAGALNSEAVEAWRADLHAARDARLAEQHTEFEALETQLGGLSAGADVRVALDAARLGLQSGSLIDEDLRELRLTAQVLTSGSEGQTQQLALQRELADLERSARDVPGALDDLTPLIAQAQAQLASGGEMNAGEVNMSALWAVLEGHLGAASVQRQDFDERADRVIGEYDAVRDLAGETIQTLGRLADTLRAQRRLGVLSADARGRYEQTLRDAEALLAEAHAEHRAAQEVTASFGEDALSGLLGVFDLEGSEEDGAAQDAPLTLERWRVKGGQLLDGPRDSDSHEVSNGVSHETGNEAAQRVVGILDAAAWAGMQGVDLSDGTHAWGARTDGQGGWRLARAESRVTLELTSRRWLESGEG